MSNDTILVVATSGRMLAQSARRAGLNPIVIDLFNDQDTRELAADVRKVHHLGPAQISPVIDYYINRYGVRDVVYGSGVETCSGSLDLLAKKLGLKGNTIENLRPLLDKKQFFKWLTKLGIHYPEVSINSVKKGKDWLMKPLVGEGGFGIKHQKRSDQAGVSVNCGDIANHIYWQRHIDGIPMSVLFLANGKKAQIFGFNQQWTRGGGFVFSGVINQAVLPSHHKKLIQGWVGDLVSVFALKGLSSLDFIWDGDRCWVLEVNPRPSASMILYDDDFAKGLLFEHINACNGGSFHAVNKTGDVRACQILYSERERRIPADIHWPEWSMDRPAAGTLIRKDHPICSIIATGSRPQEVENKLQARQQIMINKFKGNK